MFGIPVFSFRILLLGIEPPIWRSFLLRDAATFGELHVAIQKSCGWKDRHLYSFRESRMGPVIAGVPNEESGRSIPDGRQTKVGSYFSKPGQRCLYLYDFGDNWEHELTLIEVASRSKHDPFVRRLTGGERAFPPEDCGGTSGYEECLAIRNGETAGLAPRQLKEKKDWFGDWQPERFDFHVARGAFDM